ncbi:MAG: rhodanese [Verrucomicrobia bacterium]|nr:rhodanese [Verrucomicrobiota bacterium]
MRLMGNNRAERFFEDKLEYTVGPYDLHSMVEGNEPVVVLDVRTEEDYGKGHIPGAINVPRSKWDTFLGLDKSLTYVVYCYTQQCHLATMACLNFARRGFKVKELEGGIEAWIKYGYELRMPEARKAAL